MKKYLKITTTINPPVFLISAGSLILFLLYGTIFKDHAAALLPSLLQWVTSNVGWVYSIVIIVILSFVLFLMISKFGEIRLGQDIDRPEFSYSTWFAMLFSAGMGIGLVFFGVAEPIMHFISPPTAPPESIEAAKHATAITLFHWGLHGWSVYAILGLGIAYFSFRWKLPLSLRSCFYPLLGQKVHGWIGHSVDILAVLGTLFGLATSLGLGAMQVSAGFHRIFGFEHSTANQLLIISIITILATISLVTGIKKGIRRLSELNLILAAILFLFVFFAGPTRFILSSIVENIGLYTQEFFVRSFALGPYSQQERNWVQKWTMFYWGWWIAWSPFVGMFIARISKGRTIREFLVGVLFVPLGVSIVWFSTFGSTAIHLELFQNVDIAAVINKDASLGVFYMLEHLPLASFSSVLAIIVLSVFFITSSDSASYVVDMLTSGGKLNPPVWQRIFWASAEGATAAVLLYAGGKQALKALQTGVVSLGLPFSLLLLFYLVNLGYALWRDKQGFVLIAPKPSKEKNTLREDIMETTSQLQKILVPIDYSEYSLRAVLQAFQLTKLHANTIQLDLLHVAIRPADYLPLDEWIYGEAKKQEYVDDAVKTAALEAFYEFNQKLPVEIQNQLHHRIETGIPSETIVHIIEDEDYDVVVMGAQGTTYNNKNRLGSVAQNVVRYASCPVLTVH